MEDEPIVGGIGSDKRAAYNKEALLKEAAAELNPKKRRC
jgi:hypothetical protein